MARLAARRAAAALFAGHDDDNNNNLRRGGGCGTRFVERRHAERGLSTARGAVTPLQSTKAASSLSRRRAQRLVAATCRGRRRRSDRALPTACGASLRSGTWSFASVKSRKAARSLWMACARSHSSRVQPPCRGSRARAKKGRWYSLFRSVRDRRSSGSGVSPRDDDGGGSPAWSWAIVCLRGQYLE